MQADNDNPDSSLRQRLAAVDRDLKTQAMAERPDAMRMDLAAGYTRGYARASRIALEMVVAILAGVALGYGLDKWAHTTPLFILLGSLLGFAAGVMNAWRALNGTYGKVGFDQPDKMGKED